MSNNEIAKIELKVDELTRLLNWLLSAQQINLAANLAYLMAKSNEMGVSELFSVVEKLSVESSGKQVAAKIYEAWLEHNQSNILAYVAFFNYGVLLSELGELEKSAEAYLSSMQRKSDFIQPALNLGTLRERQGHKEEALKIWGKVAEDFSPETATLPLYLHAINNSGRLLEHLNRYDEAEKMLEKSLVLDPNQPDVIQHWVHLRQKQCKWPTYVPVGNVKEEDLVTYTSPLAMLSASDDPRLQLAAAELFLSRKVKRDHPFFAYKKNYGHSKLRIGYLSSDYCLHPVSLLTVQLYELHDRDRFEVYGFSWSREDGSSLRKRVVEGMDHYIRIDGMTDAEAARCIFSHEIDILIDLQGLTSGARPEILYYRPAPLQITYLGYPGSTGMSCIDYVIADKFVLPESLAAAFAEKPLYMPETFQISDRKREIGAKPQRKDCDLPEDAFIFCSFNNNFKFTETFFSAWMKILNLVPNSVLWLLADNPWAKENMCRKAEECGVDRNRLIFAGRVSPANYLARYMLADLFLDTSPFNAGTTANDALWMGVPLLTCPGKTFSSRMAGSLLTTLGLDELIANDLEDYINKAVDFALNKSKRVELKEKLHLARDAGVLFDSERFLKNYENLLSKAYEKTIH